MAGRYDSLDPVFLDVLRRIQQAASAANIPVTVCGEMAGRPLEALVLAALGYRSLSMSPISIGPVKEAILHTNISGLSSYLEFLTKSPSSSHRNRLRNYIAERRFSAGPTYV